MKVMLKEVRLAFPSLFEPKAVGAEKDKLRYSAAFPIVPGSANAKALDEAIAAVAKEKWGAKADAVIAELRGKDKVCFKHAALSKDGDVYDGFQGMYSINASAEARPLVIDGRKAPLTAKDGKPYAGCYVHAQLDVWAQDNSFGRRINATLKGLQFVRDGDAFGGGAPASADDFEAVEEGADASDFA